MLIVITIMLSDLKEKQNSSLAGGLLIRKAQGRKEKKMNEKLKKLLKIQTNLQIAVEALGVCLNDSGMKELLPNTADETEEAAQIISDAIKVVKLSISAFKEKK